jgi:hypothetical protein
VSSVSSRRRRPQPNSKARIARSRLPFKVAGSGSCQSVRASSAVNQFPSRHPGFFAPFTRRMPAATSGLNNPESTASYASRRTAASLTFMVPAARWRSSIFEMKSVTENDRLVERHSRSGAIPRHKLVDRVPIAALRFERPQAYDHSDHFSGQRGCEPRFLDMAPLI